MQKRLLAVFAHPDDESFSTGGILAKYAVQGVETYLICATRGQAGQWSKVKSEDKKLEEVREKELLKAARVLGVKEVEILDFADGKISNEQIWDLEAVIVQKMRKIKPQVVICHDTTGISGHLDHVAVSLATVRAFWKVKTVKKLYYVVFPRSLAKKYRRPFLGFPDELITTKIKVARFWPKKVEALKVHLTQQADWERFLKRKSFPKAENFYLAQTRLPRPKLPENDLFAGV